MSVSFQMFVYCFLADFALRHRLSCFGCVIYAYYKCGMIGCVAAAWALA